MRSLLDTTRRPDVTIRPDGCIEISAHAARALALRRGDVIDVCADRGELYLYVRHRAPTVGRHEAAAFPTHRRSNHFRAWSGRLCRAVTQNLGADNNVTLKLYAGETVSLPAFGAALPLIHKHTQTP